MKRIQLFEFEDYPWFPNFLRVCMTRYIMLMHRLLATQGPLQQLLTKALASSPEKAVIDMCSGAGGPMPEVCEALRNDGMPNLKLTLTDLYPNSSAIQHFKEAGQPHTSYLDEPVDATHISGLQPGVRTMVCSMHHMPPNTAKAILADAQQAKAPICIFEISDNSHPKWIWWIAILPTFLMTLLLTPMVRPMSWQQIVFTYLIPVLPIFIAWDGAVSNARTYTVEDLDELLVGLDAPGYTWEKGVIAGRGKFLYLLGLPDKA